MHTRTLVGIPRLHIKAGKSRVVNSVTQAYRGMGEFGTESEQKVTGRPLILTCQPVSVHQ